MNADAQLVVISDRFLNWLGKPLPRKRILLWEKYGRTCYWCGMPTRLVNDQSWDMATNDHIIPRYKGGTHGPDNVVSACYLCNNRRSHEDRMGLPEGALLGKYKNPNIQSNRQRKISNQARTKSATDVLREQRDQAQVAVQQLRSEIAQLKAIISGMTVWGLFRQRLAQWISGNGPR